MFQLHVQNLLSKSQCIHTQHCLFWGHSHKIQVLEIAEVYLSGVNTSVNTICQQMLILGPSRS